jgi:hypothetical protein
MGNLTSCNGGRSFNKISHHWWYCRGPLLEILQKNWNGACALLQLAISFTLAFNNSASEKGAEVLKQKKHNRDDSGGSFDWHVHVAVIESPRVPLEFKTGNQIAVGFMSVLFWWSTVNTNYRLDQLYFYNQQRFVNCTRDAIKEIAEQLDDTSQMAGEHRLTLGMMLARKRVVCVMIGGQCCTFIPNSTAPDATISKALQGLTTLANKLAENSGIDTHLIA